MSVIDGAVNEIVGGYGRLRWALSIRRHPRKRWGRVRLWWSDFVLHPLGFEIGERCEDCGRAYRRTPYHVSDARWLTVMGSLSGLLCHRCFSEREVECLDRAGQRL